MGEGIDRRTGFDKDKQRILDNFRTQADGPPKRTPHLLLNDQDQRFLQLVQHPTQAPMSQAEQDFMNVIFTSAKY